MATKSQLTYNKIIRLVARRAHELTRMSQTQLREVAPKLTNAGFPVDISGDEPALIENIIKAEFCLADDLPIPHNPYLTKQ